jgi:hypothetical protein
MVISDIRMHACLGLTRKRDGQMKLTKREAGNKKRVKKNLGKMAKNKMT